MKVVFWLVTALNLMAQPEWGVAAEKRGRSAEKREQFAGATGHLSPAAFEFVVPGVRRGEVHKRLGKPYVSSASVVVRGQMDFYVDSTTVQPPDENTPKPWPTEDVHYYEYRPEKYPSEFARIVFRQGRVWYAMLPRQIGEGTRAEVIARYGNVFEEQKIHRRSGHILSVDVILWLRKNGLAFIEKPGHGITHRIVFPAVP